MKQYQHLSSEERFYIHQAVREGKRKKEIARALGRHPSTIGREFRRNMWPSSYLYTYDWALYFVRLRKRYANARKYRKMTGETKTLVVELLKQYLSPEQISAYLKKHHGVCVSHESIYRCIYTDKALYSTLRPYLRQSGKKRRRRYGSGARATLIPNRTPIEQRPRIVDLRKRIGDWECDTVIGKDRKSALVTLVERKTLFSLFATVPRKTAHHVQQAIIALLRPHMDKVKTLTFDNGSEFTQHEKIAKALKAKTYFANPYSSWERGINENTNGLLRQFFPRAINFNTVTAAQIKRAVHLLNNRPRKTRQYKTPNQIFNEIFVPLI